MHHSFFKNALFIACICCTLLSNTLSFAHHVLGRPSYSLNEDSNTPPSLAIETQIGDYFVTYMVFPAFPKPNENGRLNLYITRIDNGQTLNKPITFTVKDEHWLPSFLLPNQPLPEVIGVQQIDDGVYRQGFVFSNAGKYLVRAAFEANGEPYEIDFPLQVGSVSPIGPIGAVLGFIFTLLVSVNLIHRKRIASGKIQQGRASL